MGRMLLSICAVVVAVGLAGAQQQTKQPDTSGNAQQRAGPPAGAASPPPTPEAAYRAYPERYSDACYNAQDHDAADLCAQWRAALAAEKAAQEARLATIASIIATFLSLATVIGLIITIMQTHGALGEARRGNRLNLMFERRSRREGRRAAEDQVKALAIANKNANATSRQVKIAQQAVEAAREAAEKQLRAYVGIDRVWSQPADNTLSSDYEVLVHIKNFGVTPANDLNVEIRFADADGKASPDQNRPSRNVHFNTLPPTQVVWPTLRIPHADVREGMAGKTTYWLVSWSYTDAFGTGHTEKILLSTEPAQWAERFVGMASIPKE